MSAAESLELLAATAVECCLLRPALAPAVRRELPPECIDRPSLRRVYLAAVACATVDDTEARYRAVAAMVADIPAHHLFTLWRPDGEVRPTLQGVDASVLLAEAVHRRQLVAALAVAIGDVEAGVPADVVLSRLEVAA